MKMNMAEDYFNIGMIVSCTTVHGQKVQGEVTAFDYGTKLLTLKSVSADGKPNLHDMRIINLGFVSDIKVIREALEPPPQLSNFNYAKLAARIKTNMEEKARRVNYIGVGVSPQAQRLFHSVTKTINEVRWDGLNIIVMDKVTIYPPYGVDSCKAKEDAHAALQHVKKIVEKYYRDQPRENSPASSTSSS